MKELTHIDTLIGQYDAVFCDVWGVVHNGVQIFETAVQALQKIRQMGKSIILLTNSPRSQEGVAIQLQRMQVDIECYDAIVTSGDVTRDLIRSAPRKVFFIGPQRDVVLLEGLSCELVEEWEASAIVCSGFLEDLEAIPDAYEEMFRRLQGRNLPFICANPDIVVHFGNQEIWCAGALARLYEKLGGEVRIAGKPHAPIYECAFKKLQKIRGVVDKDRILAIGDGLLTDVKGAIHFGLDSLYIMGGIHHHDYRHNGVVDKEALHAFFDHYGYQPNAMMWMLQ
ncbi:Predicted sugar phosphatase of the HAD superfamily [Bartonella clarridgeiae 73]|uniref:Predicted sugar phosphatase of the HAD superfamily n=1 Tax=Bartonella clarridgeiae (strain CCUG 45776 / CIP 104772 / 73) TaxID=696125 RepID=E6YGY4_BARC7|nr:TIGR01459 family HAD-type hydrolase [Bartonella clarridgeiae]WCR55292.1 MAG: HAD superfamily protein involved in N-acetyl-glucosamine catabolism [Bartonella clarridgeiae]CBI76122.1 Predicted sugar phosphatase of the HAD superfamily [Bartonella clarridgeiae 73]